MESRKGDSSRRLESGILVDPSTHIKRSSIAATHRQNAVSHRSTSTHAFPLRSAHARMSIIPHRTPTKGSCTAQIGRSRPGKEFDISNNSVFHSHPTSHHKLSFLSHNDRKTRIRLMPTAPHDGCSSQALPMVLPRLRRRRHSRNGTECLPHYRGKDATDAGAWGQLTNPRSIRPFVFEIRREGYMLITLEMQPSSSPNSNSRTPGSASS